MAGVALNQSDLIASKGPQQLAGAGKLASIDIEAGELDIGKTLVISSVNMVGTKAPNQLRVRLGLDSRKDLIEVREA